LNGLRSRAAHSGSRLRGPLAIVMHGVRLRSRAESCQLTTSKPYYRPSGSLLFAITALVVRVIVIECSLPTGNVNLVRYQYRAN
jgi:hypothetical protein